MSGAHHTNFGMCLIVFMGIFVLQDLKGSKDETTN